MVEPVIGRAFARPVAQRATYWFIRGSPDHGSLVTAVRFIVSNTPGLGSSRTEMTVRAGHDGVWLATLGEIAATYHE